MHICTCWFDLLKPMPPTPPRCNPRPSLQRSPCTSRKGTNGVSTNGVTANLMLFDRGTFWVLPLTYVNLPKCAKTYLFPQSAKTPYFSSGPMNHQC